MASSSPSPAAPFFKLLVSKEPSGQLLRIQLSVLVTTAGLFLLLVVGTRRRFVRFGSFLKYLTKIIYILIPISITYIMGLMHNASTFHVLYPYWACALIYAYGGVVTMTACDFSDNESTLQYCWSTLPLFFWTGWLYLLFSSHTKAVHSSTQHTWIFPLAFYAVLLFLLSAIMNTKETLNAFYQASKSKGLPSVVDPVVRYMRNGRDAPDDDEGDAAANPLPMSTYKYLVWGNPNPSVVPKARGAWATALGSVCSCTIMENSIGFVTTKEIWNSVGTRFLADCPGRECLKELCLSYAFFRLILRRFADFPISESSEPRTRHFIEGLLATDDLKVFHIIEVELQFLFDFFYTKSHICTFLSYDTSHVLERLFHVMILGVFAVYGLPLLISPNQKDQAKLLSIQFHGHKLEVGITRIVIIIFFLLDLWKIINVWFSNRRMVRRLCKASNTGDGALIVTRIYWIWYVKDWFSRRSPFRCLFKPWQRQLGQYSFLDSYTKVPILSHFSNLFGNLVRLPRAGQAEESSVKLSTEVKRAIVTSLVELLRPTDQPVTLSRGAATIAKYSLSVDILGACQLETDAHVILVWHIATCLCARHCHPQNNDPITEFLVATQLSKYCGYLVTFAPELLPGHPFNTKHLFDEAIKEANLKCVELNMLEENANVEINMNGTDDPDEVVENPDEVVAKGIALARRLMNEEIFSPNPTLRWQVLAEFWVELLLYLAPSDNVAIHGEYLAYGGEFITHLWAILTHAGVVNRSINCPPMENQ